MNRRELLEEDLMWKCPSCGERVEDDFEMCWNCQTEKDSSSVVTEVEDDLQEWECTACGANVSSETDTCPSCGADIREREANQNALGSTFCRNCAAVMDTDAAFCSSCASPVSYSTAYKCPACSKEVNPNAKFCKYCAADLKGVSTAYKCPACSKEVNPNAKFCKYCATDLKGVGNGPTAARKYNSLVILVVSVLGLAAVSAAVYFIFNSQASAGFPFSAVNAERTEAVSFCKALHQQQTSLSGLNSEEAPLMVSIAKWAGYVSFMGGSGESSNQQARQFAQQVQRLRQQVASVRQAIEGEKLNQAYTQTTRGNIVSELTKREQFLGEVGRLCGQSTSFGTTFGTQFQVPNSLRQLTSKLQTYSQSEDVIDRGIRDLRTKYEITDVEIR
jgi:predicted amidophosphoribosyltransferase